VAARHDGSSAIPALASNGSGRRADPHISTSRPSVAADDSASVDVLSDVLRTVRLTGALFFPMEVSSPWVDEVPNATDFASILLPGAQHVVSYHIVTRGRCWAALRGDRPVPLNAGDVLVVPHGDPYMMASAPDLRSQMPVSQVLEFFRHMATGSAPVLVTEGGGGPERADVVCGFLGCDVRPFNPVLEALPRIVYLRRLTGAGPPDRLTQLVELALQESRARQSGMRCVLLHLSELLFVEVVRRYLNSLTKEQTGWLAGLCDPITGHALALLHSRPSEPWSLERLARGIGVSRSSLAERFSELIGQPPMRYLTRWRIQLACRMLCDTTAKVSTVALDVGYRSEAAFSRAFKALVGTPPAVWQRRQLTAAHPIRRRPRARLEHRR
jgi:AraC-like DNA-binding protein